MRTRLVWVKVRLGRSTGTHTALTHKTSADTSLLQFLVVNVVEGWMYISVLPLGSAVTQHRHVYDIYTWGTLTFAIIGLDAHFLWRLVEVCMFPGFNNVVSEFFDYILLNSLRMRAWMGCICHTHLHVNAGSALNGCVLDYIDLEFPVMNVLEGG